VRFEIARASGPFELCHCTRCRKASGTAFVSGIRVLSSDFRLLSGGELIASYEAPILERPPAYHTHFCTRCGSPVPKPPDAAESFEIAAGVLDDDPGARPDRHIYVECNADWLEITDALPQLDKTSLERLRRGEDANA